MNWPSSTATLTARCVPVAAKMHIPIKRVVERVPGGLMIVPMMIGSVIVTFFPHAGEFFGSFTRALFTGSLSILAVFYVCMGAAINDTNGGLYMALMGKYGTTEEAAAYSAMSLESGPFFTMVTLGVAGLSSFPWQTLLGAILPLCVGIILGNLDPEIRQFFGGAVLPL